MFRLAVRFQSVEAAVANRPGGRDRLGGTGGSMAGGGRRSQPAAVNGVDSTMVSPAKSHQEEEEQQARVADAVWVSHVTSSHVMTSYHVVCAFCLGSFGSRQGGGGGGAEGAGGMDRCTLADFVLRCF